MTCANCATSERAIHRLQAEVLELRVQVADGPRARAQELERALAASNTVIARMNRERGYQRGPQPCRACGSSLKDCDENIRAGHMSCCSRCRYTDTHEGT